MDDVLNKNSKCNIGFGIERSEDDTLIAGKGIYGDDFGQPPGTLHVAVLRSQHASAKIIEIETSRATSIPGVKLIIDGKDFKKYLNPYFLY